jgi:hypothetical protein
MSLLDKILNKKPEMIYSAIWQPEELETDYTGYEQPQAETQTPRKGVSFETLTGLKEKIKQVPTAIENAIFGKQEAPKITTNADGTKAVTVNNNRNGGVLGFVNDFKEGFDENLTTPYNSENLLPQKKSLGERLGEGLGTATRFLDSPLGRGLAVAGAVGALGGGAGDALAYGLGTTAQNQGLRMQDRIYRNDLTNMGVDTSGINGYITEDMYKNILASRQMQENAEWRKANLLAQERQNEALNHYRQQQLAQGWANLLNKTNKNTGNIGNLQAITDQLNRFSATFKDMPNKLESNTLGRLRNATGFQTETEANFNSQRTLLFNKIARDLGGEKGVLSDQDINRIEKSLPNYTDSYAQKQAKMAAIYDLLQDRLSVEGASLNNLSVAQPKTNDLPNVEATTIRVKSPNGKIGTIPATQLEDALAAGYTRL